MPKKKVEKNENMKLWDSVSETNPAITKHVSTRGGFTAIDAQAQIKRATELFGPFGVGWGLDDFKFECISDGGKTVGVALLAKFYVSDIDGVGCSFPVASDMAYKPNDDCYKKLRTDCITKALSQLGFNSDIFEGKYDDSKYVAEMNEKYNSKLAKKETIKSSAPSDKEEEKAIVRLIFDGYLKDCPEGMVVDMVKLKLAILDKYGKFPSKEASVGKVLGEISIEDVIVNNNFPGDDVKNETIIEGI